ncbi:hypothetical protein SELMODRAFT_92610 [Selaginella moellendorffii]|uniref:Pentacotripeptide-repeat region of PRORP domain-containing protein n=1 Tax=Selaginella moellendorffii TaxID=88036 RepID=D8RFU1_SELML|nr:hypothetical protein SELMODRAFT_92610 [Selaginella moellendorffii]
MGARKKPLLAWNAIVLGYVRAGRSDRALEIFHSMQMEGVRPDERSFLAAIGACASLACHHLQETLETFSRMPQRDVVSWNSVMAAYAQDGHISAARKILERMPERNVVSWDTMVAAYAQRGDTDRSLQAFLSLLLEGLQPDEMTFRSVLTACSYVGGLEESLSRFHSMSSDFGLAPRREHCSCIVDLLGRVGQLQDAEEFVTSPDSSSASSASWGALLGACKIHSDPERGGRAITHFTKLDPENSAPYLLLASTLES